MNFQTQPHYFEGLQLAHYRVILADPPYKFSSGPSRNPRTHYRTMTIAEIAAQPIGDLAHPDGARLFLWITMPHLHRVSELLNAWGFKYCTARPWLKLWPREAESLFLMPDSFAEGTGYEVRNSSEIQIIAKRGKPQRLIGGKLAGHIIAPRREHSRKPDCARDELVRLFDGPRCELFARSAHPGFDAWGDEVGLFDETVCGNEIPRTEAPPPLEKPYDANDDFAKSLDVAYDAVRARVAAGGPGWPPESDNLEIPPFLRRAAP